MNPDLFNFLDQGLTSFHTARHITAKLRQGGFLPLSESDRWVIEPGRGYLVEREGGLAAFRLGTCNLEDHGFLMAAAHTDSPGFKVKPLSQSLWGPVLRLGVEVYGAPIHSSWLDRDLTLAGQVIIHGSGGLKKVLLEGGKIKAMIPNLALHYNRDINSKGFSYDPQTHLSALIPLTDQGPQNLEALVARELGVNEHEILDMDLHLVSWERGSEIGGSKGLFSSARIDNLTGCWSIVQGLLNSIPSTCGVLGLFFDHEEVGSGSRSGAQSSFLGDIIERIVKIRGGDAESVYRTRAKSFLLSVDAAHGLHPNFSEKHDPKYAPVLGGGPVLKINSNQRYATTAHSASRVEVLARKMNIPTQRFIMRSDLPAGTTVGPVVSASGSIPAADLGIPIWAMHSIRETASASDQEAMTELLRGYFSGECHE